jgi:hypothetical protein
MSVANRVAPLAAAALLTFPGSAALADVPTATQPVQPALWTPKELRFVYTGFTTKYSCDGLREKIRKVLLELGARKDDLAVNQAGCAGDPGRPTTFPTVSIKMNVLQPAPAPPPGANAPPAVPARWQLVDLTKSRDPLNVAGDCELIEQIEHTILPQFTTRNLEYRSSCVPNQLQLGTYLKVEALLPETPPALAPPGAAPPASQNPGSP